MGLDQWLYKMKKADPKMVSRLNGMHYTDASQLCCDACSNGHWQAYLVRIVDNPDVSDLDRCANRISLVESQLDEAKLLQMKDVPIDATYVGGSYGPAGTIMRYYIPEQDETVEIPVDDTDFQTCSDNVKCDYYVCEAMELATWRKRYDIQDLVYEHHDIENCGFHLIDDDTTLDALEDLDEDLVIPRVRENEGIYYHEWY